MLKEQCKVGMKVVFGRASGEKTLGEIVKINPSKLKVRVLQDRGARSKAGSVWNVPPAMCSPANGEEVPAAKVKPKTFTGAYYASMVGGVVESTDGDAEFPVIKMRLPNGQRIKIEVSTDGEGNGPGFLFGLPRPIQVDGGWVEGVA